MTPVLGSKLKVSPSFPATILKRCVCQSGLPGEELPLSTSPNATLIGRPGPTIVPAGTFSSIAYTKSSMVGGSLISTKLTTIRAVSSNKSYPVIPLSVTLTFIIKERFVS